MASLILFNKETAGSCTTYPANLRGNGCSADAAIVSLAKDEASATKSNQEADRHQQGYTMSGSQEASSSPAYSKSSEFSTATSWPSRSHGETHSPCWLNSGRAWQD
ncbi:predicted protein [Histoplasma capsulatum var. duboisii H88]|uniref:Predicted protein n=1 Tax=Ajellomyces capsulatus (strain H88) TaxID=544711 RepID=F0UAC1_AJEC8|nr:predicted protein [Histoplasma capsulatum var. duboisii H88]